MIAVHTTIQNEGEAEKLTSSLVKENLIACGSYFEINSVYMWEKQYTEEKEYEVVCYTKDSLLERVVQYIKKYHPYDLPKIVVFEAKYVLPEYEEWVEKQTD